MNTFLDNVLGKLQEVFDPATLGSKFGEIIVNVTAALVVLIIFYFLWRLIRLILRITLKRSPLDQTAESLIQKIVQYVVLGIGAIAALSATGTPISALLADRKSVV